MEISPTREQPSRPGGHVADATLAPDTLRPAELVATDGIEEALAVLRAHPYGAGATEEQERACRLLYRALVGRLSTICRRLGLDDEEVADVLHAELHQFFTRDVARIGATRADLERWMTVVCRNAARTVMAARLRRASHDREAGRVLEIEAEDAAVAAAAPPAAAPTTEEPHWLDIPFPARVDRARFVAALDALTPKERLLLDTAYRHLQRRDGRRLPATEIARELGSTPAAVSVRWSELLAKLRRLSGAPIHAPGTS